MGIKAITADNLVKYYGKARGIDGLNLEVETGDFLPESPPRSGPCWA